VALLLNRRNLDCQLRKRNQPEPGGVNGTSSEGTNARVGAQ
jgi:hypothetical protein